VGWLRGPGSLILPEAREHLGTWVADVEEGRHQDRCTQWAVRRADEQLGLGRETPVGWCMYALRRAPCQRILGALRLLPEASCCLSEPRSPRRPLWGSNRSSGGMAAHRGCTRQVPLRPRQKVSDLNGIMLAAAIFGVGTASACVHPFSIRPPPLIDWSFSANADIFAQMLREP